MENLELYNKVRAVPENAKRTIGAGRLKGKTDINPMWRIKILTETFGPCGIGWKYIIKREWLENGANGEIAAFVDIDLFYKANGEWSDAVPGTGGSMLVTSETKGLYTSDECFKMALTDAISVAAKAIGVAADVYWDADSTKYGRQQEQYKIRQATGTGETGLSSCYPGNLRSLREKYSRRKKCRGGDLEGKRHCPIYPIEIREKDVFEVHAGCGQTRADGRETVTAFGCAFWCENLTP